MTTDRGVRRVDVVTGAVTSASKKQSRRLPVWEPGLQPVKKLSKNIKVGGASLTASDAARRSAVILRWNGKKRTLLSKPYVLNGPARTTFAFAKWTPGLTAVVIQQGWKSDFYLPFVRVYVYDRILGKTLKLGRGRVAEASVIGKDTLAFVAQQPMREQGSRWQRWPAWFCLYRAGSGKPAVRLSLVQLVSYEYFSRRSPDGSLLAISRVVKDSFGDYERFELDIVDLKRGRYTPIALQGHEPPDFVWLDDRSIAYVDYDRYRVPVILVKDLRAGSTRTVLSRAEFGAVELVGYYSAGNRIVFAADPDALVSKSYCGSLWSIRSDGRMAKRLLESKWVQP